ncbi:transmembrane protein [Achlya hypogyna]|uniref:Transmembrane protein n=1 Tax=Achlya hypogyna TaxID=1202772 RepID=A0A1V9YUZ1_ACHHY|nr:transmembrane protein [Achlya hypogyna]
MATTYSITTPTVVEDPSFDYHPDISISVIADDSDDTALAPGPVIHEKSPPAVALYLQSILVTFMQNILPPLKLYLFTAYLHGSTEHIAQLTALENVAWTARLLFAALSDALPVLGYRRKFWLSLGWFITLVSVAVMAFTPLQSPFCDPKIYSTCWNPKANTTQAAYDLTAPSRVAFYRAPTFFATLGVVMVAANVDGLMVEYAQREPLATRGQIQILTYSVTGSGGLLARFFNQFFLNGKRYGGNYDFSAGPNVAYYLSVAMALAGLAVVVFMVHDTKRALSKQESMDASPEHSNQWLAGLWSLVQNRAVYQLLAFRLLFNLFSTITGAPIVSWVTNLDMGWINITPRMLFVPATIQFGRFGLHWNWRRSLGTATAANLALMALATFLVVYDASRNAYVYSVLLVLTGIPVAVSNLVLGFVMVEMASVGYEAVVAGLWATIKDLNVPIAAQVRTHLMDAFPATLALKNDSVTQSHVGYTHVVAFGVQLVGLVWLVLLPAQKTPVAMLKQHGGARIGGACVVLGYVALLAFCLQQNIHSYVQ